MSTSQVPSALRRLWPRRVRARLALVYALLFLVAGSALLALTYALLASRLPKPPPAAKVVAERNPELLALCKEGKAAGQQVLEKCKQAFAAGAQAGSTNQPPKDGAEKAAKGVMILVNGGPISKNEVLYAVRQNLSLIVVEGSGGLADEIATAWKARPVG